jgi:hypothetical protein
MKRARAQVDRGLSLLQSALAEMSDSSVAAAKRYLADLIPQLKKMAARSTTPIEIQLDIMQLVALLTILRRKLAGEEPLPN